MKQDDTSQYNTANAAKQTSPLSGSEGSDNGSETKNIPSFEKIKVFLKNNRSEILLIVAAFCIFLGLTYINLKNYLIVVGVLLGWSVFVCSRRFRLLLAITGIMGFNIWLILMGMCKITAAQGIATSKETAFIIAVAILAWLAISCYSLSLLKDSQLENDKES